MTSCDANEMAHDPASHMISRDNVMAVQLKSWQRWLTPGERCLHLWKHAGTHKISWCLYDIDIRSISIRTAWFKLHTSHVLLIENFKPFLVCPAHQANHTHECIWKGIWHLRKHTECVQTSNQVWAREILDCKHDKQTHIKHQERYSNRNIFKESPRHDQKSNQAEFKKTAMRSMDRTAARQGVPGLTRTDRQIVRKRVARARVGVRCPRIRSHQTRSISEFLLSTCSQHPSQAFPPARCLVEHSEHYIEGILYTNSRHKPASGI